MAPSSSDVPGGAASSGQDPGQHHQGVFSGEVGATSQSISPASIASRIPEPTEAKTTTHDRLSLKEWSALKAAEKTEYQHRELKGALEGTIAHFKSRCEKYEESHEYLVQRVAELEQSERSTKGSFDLSAISLTVGGSLISFASLFFHDAIKWCVAGLGGGMCITGLLLIKHLSRSGWPPGRTEPIQSVRQAPPATKGDPSPKPPPSPGSF